MKLLFLVTEDCYLVSHRADPARAGKVVFAPGAGVRTLLAGTNRGFRTGK